MKIRLPKKLMLALMSAMLIGNTYADTYTPNESIETGSLTSDTVNKGETHIITKDGTTTSVDVVGNVTKYASIYVREGVLNVGDGSTDTTFHVSPHAPTEGSLSIGGNQAEVIFNRANFVDGNEAFITVGNADGSGALTLTNGSNMTGGDCEVFRIGTPSYTNGTGYENGTFTPAKNGSDNTFARGDVLVSGGSALTTAKSFFMGEGSLTVEGEEGKVSKVQLGYAGGGGGYVGLNFRTGYNENTTSEITVKDHSIVEAYASQGHMISEEANTTTNITVSGQNAKLSLKDIKDKNTFAQIGHLATNTQTNIKVENGGEMSIDTDKVWLGNEGTGNSVDITVADKDSSLNVNSSSYTQMEEGTTITNHGKVNVNTSPADAFYIFGGEINNKEGATLSSTCIYSYQNGSTHCERVINNEGTMKVKDDFYFSDTTVNNSGTLEGLVKVRKDAQVNNSGTIDGTANITGGELNLADGSEVTGDIEGKGGTINAEGNISVSGSNGLSLIGATFVVDTPITINGKLSLSENGTIVLTLSELNETEAAISIQDASDVSIEGGNLQLKGTRNYKSGSQFLLFDKEVNTDQANISVEGADAQITMMDGKTVITILEDIYLGRDPLADVAIAAAWGVFNSSDAFVKTLWAPKSPINCVELNQDSSNRKVAWGAVYSHSSRIGSAGADYSIYGAAVGVESKLSANRLIGAALGYDYGKAKSFTSSAVKQHTIHLGAYGRAYHRCLNSTDSVAIDWSAAYGNTTSTHDAIIGEWSQNSLQLDARATYYRALSDNTVARVFAGAQFYAQDSDTSGGIESQAIQNLRFMLGGGISYTITPKTTVFGEVSIYGDAIRNNPATIVDGFHYTGTNPGRIGATISAGADYKVNDRWNVNIGYSFETSDDRVENYINVGASYKF